MTETGQLIVPQAWRMLAFDVIDRELLWSHRVAGRYGQPTYFDSSLATVVDYDVVILDLWTGEEQWRWTSPDRLKTEVVATIDHLVVSSVTTTYILDLQTRDVAATFPVGGRLSLSSDGVLYVASQSGELSAIRVAGDRDGDGMPDRWETENGYDPNDPSDGANDDDGDGLTNADEYAANSDPNLTRYAPVSRQPSVRRDLALLVDRDQAAGAIVSAIRQKGGPLLQDVDLFDRYEGKGVPEGKLSLGVRLVFQHAERTLTEAEVAKATERVVRALGQQFGAELR